MQKCEQNNGLEAWRILARRYQHVDGSSNLGRLRMILDFKFEAGSKYLDSLAAWELLVARFNESNPMEEISEAILKTVLIKGAPEPLKGHLEITGMQQDYREMRNAIESFVRQKYEWGDAETTAPTLQIPMDVSYIAGLKGKAKGKGKGKQQRRGKGKGAVAWTAPQPEVQLQPQPEQHLFSGSCFLCGQVGHRAYECPQGWTDSPASVPGQCWLCGGWGHEAHECGTRRHIGAGVSSLQQDSYGAKSQESSLGPAGLQKPQNSKPEDLGDVQDDTYWTMCLEPSEDKDLPVTRKLAIDTEESAAQEETSEDEAVWLKQIGVLPQKPWEQ